MLDNAPMMADEAGPSSSGSGAGVFKRMQPLEYYRRFIENSVRPDGRTLWKPRMTSVNCGTLQHAAGSSVVRVGNTMVVCGIKAEFTEPAMGRPTEGWIVCDAKLPPLCAPRFRPGPPPVEAQIVTEALHSLVTESGMVNLASLGLQDGKLCWVLYVDVVVLNHDGNVFDACLLAVTAALHNTKLPTVVYDEGDGHAMVDGSVMVPLALDKRLVSLTFVLFEGNLMADPNAEEEELMSTRIHVVVDVLAGVVQQVVKMGGVPITDQQLVDCHARAKSHTAVLNRLAFPDITSA